MSKVIRLINIVGVGLWVEVFDLVVRLLNKEDLVFLFFMVY